jgi:hypothetical protein
MPPSGDARNVTEYQKTQLETKALTRRGEKSATDLTAFQTK